MYHFIVSFCIPYLVVFILISFYGNKVFVVVAFVGLAMLF